MNFIAPLGSVYQAGTLSGNPLAVTAGLTTLKLLKRLNPYAELERRSARLEEGFRQVAKECGIPASTNRVGSMMTVFFTDERVTSWDTAKGANTDLYGRFFRAMLSQGVYLAPSQFECAFVSIMHNEDVIDKTIVAARNAMQFFATH